MHIYKIDFLPLLNYFTTVEYQMHSLSKYILIVRITYDAEYELTIVYKDFIKKNPNVIVQNYLATTIDDCLVTYVNKLLTIISNPKNMIYFATINNIRSLMISNDVGGGLFSFINTISFGNYAISYASSILRCYIKDKITIQLCLNEGITIRLYESDWVFEYITNASFPVTKKLLRNLICKQCSYQKFNKSYEDLDHWLNPLPDFKLFLNFNTDPQVIITTVFNICVITEVNNGYKKRQINLHNDRPPYDDFKAIHDYDQMF